MSKLSISIIFMAVNILILLNSIQAISLQEAFFVHQKVKEHFKRPRILTDYGPTYGGGQAPVLQLDPVTGNILVVKHQPTLQEVLQKAREKLQQRQQRQQQKNLSSSNETPNSQTLHNSNRFNHIKPSILTLKK